MTEMGWFILSLFLFLGCAVAVIVAVFDEDDRAVAVGGSVVCLVLGLALFVVSGLKSVPAKDIGVPQSFGAVGSHVYGPGIHQTWTPWLHLTDVDETVQTTTFEGDNCLQVRIGGQQTACADVTIQWEIKPSAGTALFKNYAHSADFMDTVKNAVIVREFKLVVNSTLGDYNPITDVQTVTNTNSANSQFSKFGPQILKSMRNDIGNQINVHSVLLPFIHYDNQVETKLNGIQQAFANDAIAQEDQKVNSDQNKAYQNLGSPSQNALISQCLSIVAAGKAPSGLQCFPGVNSGQLVGK